VTGSLAELLALAANRRGRPPGEPQSSRPPTEPPGREQR